MVSKCLGWLEQCLSDIGKSGNCLNDLNMPKYPKHAYVCYPKGVSKRAILKKIKNKNKNPKSNSELPRVTMRG